MDRKQRKTIAIVVLGIVVIQIIITAVKYVQSFYNLDNPLIPQGLLTAIQNYTIIVIGVYLIAVLVNVFYLLKNKFFWGAMIISFLALTVIAVFGHEIQNYFFQIK